jgi:hypothetical protein
MDNRLRWLKGFNLRLPKQRAHAANIAKNMSLQSKKVIDFLLRIDYIYYVNMKIA